MQEMTTAALALSMMGGHGGVAVHGPKMIDIPAGSKAAHFQTVAVRPNEPVTIHTKERGTLYVTFVRDEEK